jgi:hypothetical protein
VKKVVVNKKSGKTLGLLSSGKRRAFLAEGAAKMHGCKAQKKGGLERFSKKMNAKYFV